MPGLSISCYRFAVLPVLNMAQKVIAQIIGRDFLGMPCIICSATSHRALCNELAFVIGLRHPCPELVGSFWSDRWERVLSARKRFWIVVRVRWVGDVIGKVGSPLDVIRSGLHIPQ
jgi:hypothetical protein